MQQKVYRVYFTTTLATAVLIFSLLHSEIKCGKGLNKIIHVTLDVLLHFLVRFECSPVCGVVVLPKQNWGMRCFQALTVILG